MVHAIQVREVERDKALARLEVSNSELKQFAYVAAHDLKEPLRTISNYLSLLGERLEGKLDEKGERFWKTVIESSYRMDALISGLLTYAKLGNKALTPQQVDMDEVVSKVLGDLKVIVNESGAKIEKHNLPLVYADGTQMSQLLQNLLANGIKFRGEKYTKARHRRQSRFQWLDVLCSRQRYWIRHAISGAHIPDFSTLARA